MAITTYNTDYYDDLNIPDAYGLSPLDKNYLRVLFRPGVSVQTRELNQLQSAIQAQLDRLGESLFRSGKPVLGGIPQFDDSSKISSVDVPKFELADGVSLSDYTEINKGELTATIVEIKELSLNSYRVYYKVTSLDTDSSVNINNFVAGDTVSLSSSLNVVSCLVSSVNRAVGAHISQGVYFTKGSYAVVSEQVATYDVDSKFTGYVVLRIDEFIKSASGLNGDPTLNDNASGSYNYGAPGADRYAIDLTLELVTSIPNDNDYITLLTIQNDIIILDNSISGGPGSLIDDKLAQRTYEESGDYEVHPFPIHILEAYNDGTNGGLYTSSELATAGYTLGSTSDPDIAAAQNDLVVKLDPSVAYVKGYRVELKNSIPLSVHKARDVESGVPLAVSADMGMYVDVQLANGSSFPNIQNASSVYKFAYSNYHAGDLGSARIRTIEFLGGSSYRVFLYDIYLNDNVKIDYGVDLIQTDDDVTFNVLTPIQKTDNPYGFFKLPHSPIQNIEDVRFTYKKQLSPFNGSASSTTVAVSTGIATDIIDTSPTNIIVQIVRGGNTITVNDFSINVVSSSMVNLTIPNTQVGDIINVTISVTTNAHRGTKTLKSATATVADLDINLDGLYVLPVYHLVSVDSNSFEIVNDGQYPAHYTYATVRYVGEGTPPSTFAYTYFEFSDDADFFDSTSYFRLEGSTSVQMSLEEIPEYDSIPLYSVLDFRYYYDPSDASATFRPIDAYSPITFDSTHYLPRIDTVLVSQTGAFYINQGKSDLEAKKPKVPDTAMELYVLTLGPYTFGPDDVKIEKVDNQRYTMNNIRAIDKRVSNLEYYTTLSLLEKSAKDTSIMTDGIDRFKNGFVVDNFSGHNVGDPSNPDYICSVDEEANELRPAFSTSSFKLDVLEDQSVNVTVHDRAATLSYSSTPYISQSYGSDHVSVNPFNSSVYVGKLKLYPHADHWCDTNTRPKVNTKDDENRKDGIRHFGKNQTAALASEGREIQVFGTEWKSWETYWSGKNKYDKKPNSWFGSALQTGNTSNYRIEENLKDYRNKIKPSDKNKVDKGNRVVDINIRPYIRARYVYFKAHSLKPNTIYYPFFDGVNVSEHCYSRTANNFKKKNNKASRNGEDIPSVKSTNHTIKSDSKGNVYGLFIIPNTKALRFLSGVRQFKLTDSRSNLLSETSSYAAADYFATGLIKPSDKAIVSNAVPEYPRGGIIDSRPATCDSRTSTGKKISWIDPVAQSFLISNPEGIFATKVDLYFANRPTADIPVEIYIVTCENGTPTQNIVPLSTVSKERDEVYTNVKGATATTFTFEQPVYLAPGQEYALVITSTSSDYRLYVATLGQRDEITSKLISTNPYNGVFFKSQNSSTWSADQSKDLKFRLHRAVFATSGTLKTKTTSVTSIERIQVTESGSGYSDTSLPTVTIAAPSTVGGIAATAAAVVEGGKVSSINLTYDDEQSGYYGGGLGYSSSDIAITIAAPGTGTTATAVAVMPNAKVSSFVLDQDVVEISTVDETDPTKDIHCSVSNSVSVLGSSYTVEPHEAYNATLTKKEWSFPGVNYAYPVEVETVLTTTSDYISPVVDIDRANIKLFANRILTDEALTSKYITRSIQLAQLADQLDIYFDINRPSTACDIKVYAQFNDPSTRTETDWIEITQRISPLSLPTNSNPDEFSELHYMISRETQYPFNSFKVKIVFIGSNIVDAPRIKNFRAIATM